MLEKFIVNVSLISKKYYLHFLNKIPSYLARWWVPYPVFGFFFLSPSFTKTENTHNLSLLGVAVNVWCHFGKLDNWDGTCVQKCWQAFYLKNGVSVSLEGPSTSLRGHVPQIGHLISQRISVAYSQCSK